MKTIGISPKVIVAAVLPALAGLVAVGVQWIATGSLDRGELATAIGAVVAAALSALGGYLAPPGEVVPVVGPANDDLLGYPGPPVS